MFQRNSQTSLRPVDELAAIPQSDHELAESDGYLDILEQELESTTDEEDATFETRWIESDKFSWIEPFCKEIDQCLKGNKSRGRQCNATKKTPSTCSCSPEFQTSWTQIYQDPPDPLMRRTLTDQPSNWHRTRIYFWVPELFYNFRIRHLPCPQCGPVDGQVKMTGWNRAVS